MILFRKGLLYHLNILSSFQFREDFSDQSNELWNITCRKEPLDHIGDLDDARPGKNMKDNVEIRTVGWIKGINLINERTFEDIEERHSKLATSGAVSLSLTKPNKLQVIRTRNH
jgi:hypothetical protein